LHSYLKSIGFSNIKNKKELDEILKEVIENYDEKTVVEDRSGHLFAEISKIYGCDYGITVCGEYDENNEFQMEYYFPHFRGTGITTREDIIIEKHAGKESFAGACDDVRIGVTMIFYLQNAGEYLSERGKGNIPGSNYSVTLSGMAKEGKILLPVKKDTSQVKEDNETTTNRNRLIAAARNGDEDAMESLTMEDIDMYAMISRRIAKEDVYSIVDSYFMPYGIECDQYNIMGDILDCSEVKNIKTGDIIYEMSILCNDIQFDVCINKNDLLGEPQPGRRFKGIIWLQGYINFNE
jgi:hypothetical protein